MNRHASMNRAFRLVWSAARGAYLVAPETARGRGKSARALVVAGALCVAGLATAQVTPVAGNTSVANSPNGVPVVNINTANGAGLSHNQYGNYNVDSRGLVLNNGMQAGVTSLAGMVQANPNLNAPARVILNEVVAPNRSTLAGFTEVAGAKADVIVANPYGITCSGCGFLNTDRVTITTGAPDFGADGSLAGFRVSRGDVQISGAGLNASAQQLLDIVTRSLRTDGQIRTAEGGALNITLGNNVWNYASGEVTGKTAPDGAASAYALDSSALGGMYAGRIRITATEAGVGVRMLGEAAASASDFRLDAAGNVLLAARLLATGEARISGDAVSNTGWIQGNRGVTIGSAGAFVNGAGGTLLSADAGRDMQIDAASVDNRGKVQSAGALRITAQGDFINRGTMFTVASSAGGSDGLLQLQAGRIDNAGTLQSAGAIDARAEGDLINAGIMHAGGALAASAGALLDNDGANAEMVSGGDLSLQAAILENNGLLQAARHLSASAVNGLTNTGVILNRLAHGDMALAGAEVQNIGTIQAAGAAQLSANAGAFRNRGSIAIEDALAISAAEALENADADSRIFSNGPMGLAAGSIDNRGRIVSGKAARILAGTLANKGKGAAIITGSGKLNIDGELRNEGAIHGDAGLDVQAGAIVNRASGGMSSLGDVALSTKQGGILNEGALYAGGRLSAKAVGQTISNEADATMDANDISTDSARFVNRGSVDAKRDIAIRSTESFSNLPADAMPGIQRYASSTPRKEIYYRKIFNQGDPMGVFGYTEERVFEVTQTVKEALDGAAPARKGRIIAGNSLDIDYGRSGENLAGLLSAKEMRIRSSAAEPQAFVNQDLHVDETTRVLRWKEVHVYKSVGKEEHSYSYRYPATDDEARDVSGATFTGVDLNSGNAVERAHWLETDRKTVDSDGAGIHAGKLSFERGTLRNVGSPYQPTIRQAREGQIDAERAALNPNAPMPGYVPLQLSLPESPNGYFIRAASSGARYLIETNPLFINGSPAAQAAATASKAEQAGMPQQAAMPAAPASRQTDSDYLARKLGFDPDTLIRRLGDANYEARLIREQLIALNGRQLLQGQRSESAQYQTLMEQGAAQAAQLGLRFGEALTPEQIDQIEQDMVWVVEKEVGGQRALVPVVYLSAATRAGIVKGAVIAADEMRINADAVENRGGLMTASRDLDIRASGDVHNLGGDMRGGNLKAQSLAGSVINDSSTDAASGRVGKRATMKSEQDLTLAAAQDVLVQGASLAAGGNASIAAGRNVSIIDAKQIGQRAASGNEDGKASRDRTSASEVTLSRTAIGSDVTAGGSVSVKSAADLMLDASSVKAGRDVDLDAGRNLGILAGQDVQREDSTKGMSGMGVAGGAHGSTTVTENRYIERNVAASVVAGGDLRAGANGEMLVRGSRIDAGGNVELAADAVHIDAGRHVKHDKRVTDTTTVLKAGAEAQTATNARAQAASASASETVDKRSSTRDGKEVASETATAKRSANASTDVETGKPATPDPKRKVVDEESSGTSSQQARSSAVDSRGRTVLNASDTQSETSASKRDDGSSNRSASSRSVSREDSLISQGKPDASSGAGETGRELSAKGSASASASASAAADANGQAGLAVFENNRETVSSQQETAVASSLSSGGNLSIRGRRKVVMQGAKVDAAKDASISADQVDMLAARDISILDKSSDTTSVGFLIDSKNNANAGASSKANAEGSGKFASSGGDGANVKVAVKASGSASASADAKAGASSDNNIDILRNNASATLTTETSNQGSAIRSGGTLSIAASGKLATEGAQLSGDKRVALSAQEMEFREARDRKESVSSNSKTAVGLYVDANGNARANASVDIKAEADLSLGNHGLLNQDSAHAGLSGSIAARGNASADAKAGAGMQFRHETASETKSSSNAKVTTIRSGSGDIERNADARILDVGTDINAAGDFSQKARSVESLAAANTESSTVKSGSDAGKIGAYAKAGAGASASFDASGGAGVGYTGNRATGTSMDQNALYANANAGGEAQYQHKENTKTASSSTAVVSSIKAGGQAKSVSSDATTLEGTKISAKNVAIEAGSLDARAAKTTRQSSEESIDGQGKINAGVNAGSDGAASGALSGSFEKNTKSSASSDAVVSRIEAGNGLVIRTGGDARFEGTKLQSGGDARLDVGGKLDVAAAQNTRSSSEEKIRGALSGSAAEANGKKGLALEGEYVKKTEDSSKAVVADITSGGSLALSTGGDARLEGARVKAAGDTAIDVKGNLKLDAARDTANSESINASGKLKLGAETATDTKKSEQTAKNSFGLDLKGQYEKTGSDSAVTSSISSGGDLRMRAGGNADIEGADLRAGKQAQVTAGGDLNLRAAQDKTTSTRVSGELNLATTRKTTSSTDAGSDPSSGNVADSRKLGLSLSGDHATSDSRRGGTIQAGAGVELGAGRDLSMEGGAVKAGGDVNVSAGRDLALNAASSKSNSIGASLDAKQIGESNTVRTDKDNSSSKAGGALRGSINEHHEGTAVSGNAIRLQSGDKTSLTNTEIQAKTGTVIAADKGVTTQTLKDRNEVLNLSGSTSAKSGGKPAAAAPAGAWTAASPEGKDKPASATDNSGTKPQGPVIGAARKPAQKKPTIGHAHRQAAAKKQDAAAQAPAPAAPARPSAKTP